MCCLQIFIFTLPDSCLVRSPASSLSPVIMPRGQKSKSRSRAKRQQARSELQGLSAVHTGNEAACPPVDQSDGSRSPDVCALQELKPPGSHRADVSCTGSGVGVKNAVVLADKQSSGAIQTVTSIQHKLKDPIMRKASVLIEFLLDKFKMKEAVTRSEMLAIVNKKYKEQFPEILRRTSARLELVFGLELKEIDPSTQSYLLVGKLGLSTEGSLSSNWGLPRTGLLMSVLGVIFMKGNRATEQEVWQFLNGVGVYAGKKHLIFGEPQEFINKDLVQENYLEYRQIPGSDPPCYEFLWGPRAHAETTKMKVLEVLAKVSGTVPSAFPNLYQLALRDQAGGIRRRGQGRAGKARIDSKTLSHKKAASPKQGLHTRPHSRKVAGPQQALWVAGWSPVTDSGSQDGASPQQWAVLGRDGT
ncbi:melanoma-associated antigen B4-like [Arvicola amphibius]|uniref:melanoma-associated antigen B4-like n=1 Tax=Arvicola amphibius TaxID=1047088 RepID=UPI001C09A872|nr:melanoma-associated antigen B4-like [Arvicola amphibius]